MSLKRWTKKQKETSWQIFLAYISNPYIQRENREQVKEVVVKNVDCQYFLRRVNGAHLRHWPSPVFAAFKDNVNATVKLFRQRILRLKYVGFFLPTMKESPLIFARRLTMHMDLLEKPIFPSIEHKGSLIYHCELIDRYKKYLRGQRTNLKTFKAKLTNILRKGSFAPFEEAGYTFETENDVRKTLDMITKGLKQDAIVMRLIENPHTQHEPGTAVRRDVEEFPIGMSGLPPELRSIVAKYIPVENYKWEKNDDCAAFLSKISPRVLRDIHLDYRAYSVFWSSVRESLMNLEKKLGMMQIIGHFQDHETDVLHEARRSLFPLLQQINSKKISTNPMEMCRSLVKNKTRCSGATQQASRNDAYFGKYCPHWTNGDTTSIHENRQSKVKDSLQLQSCLRWLQRERTEESLEIP